MQAFQHNVAFSSTTTTTNISVVETVHGTERKPRFQQQWEEIAHANTQKVTQLGANVPLAWVLVNGKNIPPNAIVAGEDKRRPLYIARTFMEGGVHIGQAGQHLEKGASFAYNGKEVLVDTYEVLVPLQQKITYHVADNYCIPAIPRITRTTHVVDATLIQLVQKLRAIKVVMVIDDSLSMKGALWRQARSALTGLVSVIESDMDTNGIDLCFLNDSAFEANIRDCQRVENLFDSVEPTGTTPTGRKLRELFGRYMPLIESPNSTSPPIVLMVITDGVPTDEVEGVIIDGARRLDRNHVDLRRFGVSFVQIGNDPDAADFLRELDDDISANHGCRDMVDTTPYDPTSPEFTRDVFLKCVLGSIDPYFGNLPPPSAVDDGSISPYGSPKMAMPSAPPKHPRSQLLHPTPMLFAN